MIDRESRAKLTYAESTDPFLKKWFITLVEYATGRNRLERVYTHLKKKGIDRHVWGEALEMLEIQMEFEEGQLAKIPATGPVIFVANHPFGVVDGMILCELASRVRAEYAVLVNSVLCQEPGLEPYLFPIDFRENREAMRTNINSSNQAIETLNKGGGLAIFPAGAVSTSKTLFGKAIDEDWKRFVAKMVHRTQATVVPVFFYGQNSRLFQIVSHIHMTLRLSLLLFEVKNKRRKPISLKIGNPVPYADLASFQNRQDLVDRLRKLTYSLETESIIKKM